jgi:hypothetical protein
MPEAEEVGSWKKLKKWNHERSSSRGIMEEAEEVGSRKKLKKWDHGRS